MSDRRESDDTVVRRVLKSEVTWIISVLVFGWGVVTKVILPINTMQIQLAQINMNITDIQGMSAQITKNSNDIIRLIADDPKFKR